ncbi:uncharacterized protein LOC122092159 isoform X1 [Macadamia integrifolia]|uniref:uncharacterized protein LOC122092159 isoform X1 n=1 Tax=Macadamia integrifolia TaxID=60698 RepID=UPI001C4E825E|nr:uncharacterized protein LOC122092159 isoform X1 [Macadamia integrifolia]
MISMVLFILKLTIEIDDIDGPIHIEINNPKLKRLCIYGSFITIYLKDLKLLVYARISMDFRPNVSRTCNFSNFFGALRSIQELSLEHRFLQLSNVAESAIVPVIDLQQAKDQLDSTFNKLQVVGIFGFHCKEIELVLIEFILANSSVLETMNISHEINDTNKELTWLKELLRLKRASTQAEIVLKFDRSLPS